ncbi:MULTISPECIES: SAM-dependent methyltransferase [unclassified Amycolatopsis]|uniref:SAM-dependent methyltransferase n=1 Tax=unclassified Amycolatopsis TaxID=2618356 RepID=UPI0028743F48|nr:MULTISPECIES: SAM-dependent methyltransferase [unclassified Amycolatopsis]MDS0140571.1 SAM-dependent methyltransferase [Amycolatopsis sp. 505]MDS0149221.1 SAM-dependent methyltransferase [Amycolatopsis sp. CM201R]
MNATRTPEPGARISRQPVGVDPTRPMIARIYNAYLGGKDHYHAEQLVTNKLTAAVPDAYFVFTSEIEFLQRAVRHLAIRGVTQWVVALAGLLPQHVDRVDEIVCRTHSDARVWYVEYEPAILAHLRALVANEDGEQTVRVVAADPLDPIAVWDGLAKHDTPIEPGPVCLVLGGVLSYHPGTRAEAAAVAQQHIARLPPGSYVVLTHLHDPEDPELEPMVRGFRTAMGSHGPPDPGSATRGEIRAMVAGTTILEPGPGKPCDIVPAFQWWRDGPNLMASEPATGPLVAGVVAAVGPD